MKWFEKPGYKICAYIIRQTNIWNENTRITNQRQDTALAEMNS